MASVRKYEGKRGTTWYFVYDAPPERPGVRNQKTVGGFHTKKAAQAAMATVLASLHRGTYIEPAKQPTGEYLMEWLERTASTREPGSTINYRYGLQRVIKHVGSIPLGSLTPIHLQRAYDVLAKTYAPTTLRATHGPVHTALEQAVKWELIPRNPADHVVLPSGAAKEVPIWTRDDAQRFLGATKDHVDYALWRLLIDTHMRPGEGLALLWDDIDLETGHVLVHRTVGRAADGKRVMKNRTKTGGQRRLSLSPATVTALKAHRARQNARRLAAGPHWHATGLAFDRGDGKALCHSTVAYRLRAACQEVGVAVIVPKALRHTGATLAVASGVPLHTVSKRLGHSTIKLTADLYAHATVAADQAASAAMERILDPDVREM